MPGTETEMRRDVEPTGVDPRLAQQNEAVRQMEAEGFMAGADEAQAVPPVSATPGLPHP